MDKHPNHSVGCTLSHLTGPAIEAWSKCDGGRGVTLGPQNPCPCCGEPMGGVGWRVAPHDCDVDPMLCPVEHVEHWIGPWGDCSKCATQEVMMAALKLNVPQGIVFVPNNEAKGLFGASG